MKIYNLNKISKEYIRDLIIKDLPNSITTDPYTTKLEVSELMEGSYSTHTNKYRPMIRSNRIRISNIEIKDNWITGDIEILKIVIPHSIFGDKIKIGIDLLNNNEYKILFKPSFETEIRDSNEGLVATKFHNFNIIVVNKSEYREDRLSKLLDIN